MQASRAVACDGPRGEVRVTLSVGAGRGPLRPLCTVRGGGAGPASGEPVAASARAPATHCRQLLGQEERAGRWLRRWASSSPSVHRCSGVRLGSAPVPTMLTVTPWPASGPSSISGPRGGGWPPCRDSPRRQDTPSGTGPRHLGVRNRARGRQQGPGTSQAGGKRWAGPRGWPGTGGPEPFAVHAGRCAPRRRGCSGQRVLEVTLGTSKGPTHHGAWGPSTFPG